MMLTSEPVLGSMVITSEGVWDHRVRSPNGLPWPVGTSAEVKVTDRGGAELAAFEAEPGTGDKSNVIRFVVDQADLVDIPDGSNFETFVTLVDDETSDVLTYKVMYGRVVRRQVSYPLNPVNSDLYNAAQYTDNVGSRDTLGPLWVQKAGKTVMHDNSFVSKPYGMGNDFILFDSSATHWYAPLRSDSVKVQVSLMKFLGGETVIVLCSNYGMTDWIGVKFNTGENTVRPVTGSVSGPTSYVNQGVAVSNLVSTDAPDTYTAFYDFPTNTLKLFKGVGTTPLLTWVDETHVVTHGEGHRYTGMIYKGGLLTIGPQVTYWSAKDDL